MTALAINTFATVSFNKNAQFDFESLVAEFQQALEGGLSGPTRMHRVGGQFVSFDMGPAKLSLAYSSESVDRESQRHQHASLAVFVSANEALGKTLSSAERASLCKGVLDRIEALYPCDHRVWGETDRDIQPLYSAELAENAQLSSPVCTKLAPRRVAQLTNARRSRPLGKALDAGPDDQQTAAPKVQREPIRLAHHARYADGIKQARSKAPTQGRAIPRQVALGLPQTESRDLMILRNVFLPDSDVADMSAHDRTVAHRLAIYTLNTSLVLICLPVGAAMFSYCAMGRENLNAVGRAMALTGIGIALTQPALAQTVLPMIS